MTPDRRSRSAIFFLALFTVLLFQPAWADSSELVSSAKARLAEGDADAAFSLLADMEPSYAGEIEFDYWLGLTANRAGKFSRALFALERVLAQRPNHAAARLELAMAYTRLSLGDAARRELDILDAQDPPPAAQSQIAELRRQLGLGDQARRFDRRVAFVTLEGGFDDNAGTYPKDFGFDGPEEISSPYGLAAAGMRQRFDLKSNQRLVLSLNTQLKRFTDDGEDINSDATQFDQDFVGGRVEWSRDRDGLRETALGLDVGYLQLDGEHYYTYVGGDAEWRKQVNAETRTLFTVGVRDMTFENEEFDNLTSRIRGGVRYRASRTWLLSGDVTVEYEADESQRPGGDALRASLTGVATWQFLPDQRLSGDLNYARTEYTADDYDPFPDARRDDRILVGMNWDKTFQYVWQLRARVQYRDQDSSLTTYTFDQTSGSVSLTRYF